TDPDNDQLISRVTATPPQGAATPNFTSDSANVLRWSSATPAGNYTVAVTADDQQGGTDAQTYTLVVGGAAANRPPSITTKPLQLIRTSGSYPYAAPGPDPDRATLSFTMSSGPTWLTMDTNGLLHGTAPASVPVGGQTYTVKIQASDGHGNAAEQTFTITVRANTAPHFTTNPVTSVIAGLPYRYDV